MDGASACLDSRAGTAASRRSVPFVSEELHREELRVAKLAAERWGRVGAEEDEVATVQHLMACGSFPHRL